MKNALKLIQFFFTNYLLSRISPRQNVEIINGLTSEINPYKLKLITSLTEILDTPTHIKKLLFEFISFLN